MGATGSTNWPATDTFQVPTDNPTTDDDGNGNRTVIEMLADLGAALEAARTDTRWTNARTPSDDSVTSAKIVDGAIVNADVNAAAAIAESKLSLASDAAAGTASRRTLGTGATQAAAGNDSRLSDARTPTTHSDSVHSDAGTITGNNQTGTTYTLVLGDLGKCVECNNASAITLTVPTNATAALPVGALVEVFQQGAGQVTIAAAGGVTLRTPNGAKTAKQYSTVVLRQRAADEWIVNGDTAV